jgi:hypothetical protein
MNLRTVFSINVPISALFGITCLFVPKWLISLYGVDLTSAGAAMTRLAGAAFLGFGILAFVARSSPSEDFLMTLALALFVQDSIGAIVSIYAQISGVFNALGWSTVAVYLLLAVAYGYFRFLKPEITPVVAPS